MSEYEIAQKAKYELGIMNGAYQRSIDLTTSLFEVSWKLMARQIDPPHNLLRRPKRSSLHWKLPNIESPESTDQVFNASSSVDNHEERPMDKRQAVWIGHVQLG